MDALLERSAAKKRIADGIIRDLGLFESWGRFGRPVLVGACALDLVSASDIDMEIYCHDLKIEHGFQVMSEFALNPRVCSVLFENHLHDSDRAL